MTTTVLIVDDHPASAARRGGYSKWRGTTSSARPRTAGRRCREACDFGRLIDESGARGLVPKAELSGEALSALLAR